MLDTEGWDRRYAARDLVFSAQPAPIIEELVSPLRPGWGLDLGCGEGRHALWLARQGWRVTAVDFSSVGLEKAKARAVALGVQIECVHADLYDYRPPPDAFDLVLLAYVHPDPARRVPMFARASEALRPGGHLVIVGRDLVDLDAGYGPSDPERRYTTDRLAAAFPSRVVLERCEQVIRERRTAEGPRTLVDTVAWGRRPDAPA